MDEHVQKRQEIAEKWREHKNSSDYLMNFLEMSLGQAIAVLLRVTGADWSVSDDMHTRCSLCDRNKRHLFNV